MLRPSFDPNVAAHNQTVFPALVKRTPAGMKVGFTGTQHGMTTRQHQQVIEKLLGLDVSEFHHGDCIGSDAEAHAIAQSLGIRVVVHPPENDAKRAFVALSQGTAQRHADENHVPRPYLKRNHDIVLACKLLIATPKQHREQRRSGTWATIRFANRNGVEVVIIEP